MHKAEVNMRSCKLNTSYHNIKMAMLTSLVLTSTVCVASAAEGLASLQGF